MRWLPLVGILATTATAAAGADDPTRVTVRLEGKTARLTAHYELPVGANDWVKGLMLTVPAGALVTGALVTENGGMHRLELMHSDAASAKFAALAVAKAAPGPRTSAVLIEQRSGGVSVSVASPRTGRLAIDLEVAMPTCFHGDARYALVPASWHDVAGRDLRRERATAETLVTVCGASSEDGGMWLGFESPGLSRRKSGDRFGISAHRVDLGDDSVVRFELDVATMLADVPRDLATVLIVDGSRSISNADRAAQAALVESYLDTAPSSHVQVVSFARTATTVLPAWTTAAKARASVDRALRSLVPRNGSNFDTALAEAGMWLGRIEGTRRVVLVTDERMASRLAHASDDWLHATLPAGTLLHVVVVSTGTGLSRDDELKLSGLAKSTQGVAVRLGSDQESIDATMLLRPTSIDRLSLVAQGWNNLPQSEGMPQCGDDNAVRAGEACTWWGQGHGEITVEGWIWGKRIARTLNPDLSRSRDVARELVIRGGELSSLAESQAQAVTSTWSLYGAWGGTAGYDGSQGGGTGFGAICGCGPYGTLGHGSGTGYAYRTPSPDLAEQLRPAIEACMSQRASVIVAVELTGIEIADVHVAVSGAPRAEGQRVAECVREVVWASSPAIDNPRDYHLVSFVIGHVGP